MDATRPTAPTLATPPSPATATAPVRPVTPPVHPKRKIKIQFVIAGLVMLLLIIGGGVALFLSRQNQEVRQQASTGTYCDPAILTVLRNSCGSAGVDTVNCKCNTTTGGGSTCTPGANFGCGANGCAKTQASICNSDGKTFSCQTISACNQVVTTCSSPNFCTDTVSCVSAGNQTTSGTCSSGSQICCQPKSANCAPANTVPTSGQSCCSPTTPNSSGVCSYGGTACSPGAVGSCGGLGCDSTDARICSSNGTWGGCVARSQCTAGCTGPNLTPTASAPCCSGLKPNSNGVCSYGGTACSPSAVGGCGSLGCTVTQSRICSSDGTWGGCVERAACGGTGGTCNVNADCASGLICSAGKCITNPGCRSDADCPSTARCDVVKKICVANSTANCPSGSSPYINGSTVACQCNNKIGGVVIFNPGQSLPAACATGTGGSTDCSIPGNFTNINCHYFNNCTGTSCTLTQSQACANATGVGYYCPGGLDSHGICLQGTPFSVPNPGPGGTINFSPYMPNSCGAYQFDYDVPGVATGTGGCGAVTYSLGTNCSHPTVSPTPVIVSPSPVPSTPPGGSPPPSTPPGAPVCLNVTISKANPVAGDTVTLTCGTVAGSNHYEFRVRLPDGTFKTLTATGNTAQFTVATNGQHFAQCRICTTTDPASCQPYEPLP